MRIAISSIIISFYFTEGSLIIVDAKNVSLKKLIITGIQENYYEKR